MSLTHLVGDAGVSGADRNYSNGQISKKGESAVQFLAMMPVEKNKLESHLKCAILSQDSVIP